MTTRSRRRGFTLVEVIVVMAILILLAIIVLPSLGAFRGDTRSRAAGDVIRGELAVARARAKDEGKPYRVALSPDGRRLRRAPDAADFAQAPASDQPDGSAVAVEYAFEHVAATVVAEGDAAVSAGEDGWVTLATLQPDGTCREVTNLVVVKEDGRAVLYLRLRGLTGSVRVVPPPANGSAR